MQKIETEAENQEISGFHRHVPAVPRVHVANFRPVRKDRQEAERKTGFNAELPDPKGTGIEADKMAAYEQADMIRRQEEKKRTLADFSALTDGHRQDNVPKTEPAQDIASEMKAVRTIQEETAGREPSPLQPRLTTTSTPLSAVLRES